MDQSRVVMLQQLWYGKISFKVLGPDRDRKAAAARQAAEEISRHSTFPQVVAAEGGQCQQR